MPHHMEVLRSLETGYSPNQTITADLAHRHTVAAAALIPFGSGLGDVLKRTVAMKDPEFGEVRSMTTRERRTDERALNYHFQPHTPQFLDTLIEQVQLGRMLQFTVAPANDRVYGSYLRNYAKPYMMIDVMARAMPQLESLPFQRLVKLAIAPTPKQWAVTSTTRLEQTPLPELVGHLQESAASLEWALEQGDDVHWLKADGKDAKELADEAIAVTKGSLNPGDAGRQVGEQLFRHLRGLVS